MRVCGELSVVGGWKGCLGGLGLGLVGAWSGLRLMGAGKLPLRGLASGRGLIDASAPRPPLGQGGSLTKLRRKVPSELGLRRWPGPSESAKWGGGLPSVRGFRGSGLAGGVPGFDGLGGLADGVWAVVCGS